jgi:hypothetical protein
MITMNAANNTLIASHFNRLTDMEKREAYLDYCGNCREMGISPETLEDYVSQFKKRKTIQRISGSNDNYVWDAIVENKQIVKIVAIEILYNDSNTWKNGSWNEWDAILPSQGAEIVSEVLAEIV